MCIMLCMNRLTALLEQLENHPFPKVDLKLARMQMFLRSIQHPERRLPPVIHVAGTNGKGSTLAFLHAMIEAAGMKAHRYTSPHLVRFNERFILANEEASDAVLVQALERLLPELEAFPLTYFETATALAFLLYAEHHADFTLLEVGMGGRLDATNVVEAPLATIITPISLDHQDFLGETLAKIAYEKACIMKQGVPCIIGHQPDEAREVMIAHASEMNAPLHLLEEHWEYEVTSEGGIMYRSANRTTITPPPALHGAHQYGNAALAIACMDKVSTLPEYAISQGIASAYWAGRLQALTSQRTHHHLIIDGGHNPAAAEALSHWMQQQTTLVHVVVGMHHDKDVASTLRLLARCASSMHLVPIRNDPKALSAEALEKMATQAGIKATAHPSLEDAIAFLTVTNAHANTILITGSLYLVGEALNCFS
jgi:dihydrofolate synthase / folylpolyglutamate synthase